MSYTESWTGKFRIVAENLQDGLEIINKDGLKENKDYKIWMFEDEVDDVDIYDNWKYDFIKVKDGDSKKFVLIEKIEEIEINDYDYYVNSNKSDDGIISFSTRFYNGGACMYDIYQEIIEKYI